MQRIMKELHRDHGNINRLLKLLEGELEKLAEDGDPDFDLMIDIVDYVENYPDLVHHPREDVVYKAYQAKSLDGQEIVERLLEEHKQLPQITHEFKLLLEEVNSGAAIVSRVELIDKARAYIEKQRVHLVTEESLLFPMIKEVLDDDDWKTLESSMPVSKDPLFDAELDRYENILTMLKEREDGAV